MLVDFDLVLRVPKVVLDECLNGLPDPFVIERSLDYESGLCGLQLDQQGLFVLVECHSVALAERLGQRKSTLRTSFSSVVMFMTLRSLATREMGISRLGFSWLKMQMFLSRDCRWNSLSSWVRQEVPSGLAAGLSCPPLFNNPHFYIAFPLCYTHNCMDSDRSEPGTVRKNGTLDDRVEKIRESRRPQPVVEKADKNADYLKVNADYMKERKEFKNKNLEKIKFAEVLLKEAMQKRQFYPYVLHEPEKVSLKDDKPNIEMKKGRINVNEVVLSRNGEESFPISKFFNTHAFVECSMQYRKDPIVMPDWDFFVFDGGRGHSEQLKEMFKESGDDLGNQANQIRKRFRKLYQQQNFMDVIHILVNDILPIYTYEQEQFIQHTQDQSLMQMMFQPYTQRLIQCNDDRDGWSVCPPNLYFKNMKIYHEHKKQQIIEAKKLNIYSKEVEVYSDIRYILHPEKTYFIQIMEEVKQAIQTANDINNDQGFEIEILEQIYDLIYVKAQEFLLLICTYIPSSIDLQIRTNKLSEYFWSNFMFIDEIHEVSPELLSKYNVLGSWHSMPKRMFGYKKEEIQTRFYSLIKAGCRIQRRLNFKKKLNDLTISNQLKIEAEAKKKLLEQKKKQLLSTKDKPKK